VLLVVFVSTWSAHRPIYIYSLRVQVDSSPAFNVHVCNDKKSLSLVSIDIM
jgi:hypothetical protein